MDGLSSVSYEHQFNKTYEARLGELKPHIVRSVRAVCSDPMVDSILDIESVCGGRRCVVSGTLFIVSDLKPTIFDKIDRKSRATKEIGSRTYYSRDVKYFLEDASGRMGLELLDASQIYKKHFVISTGMCIGVVGRMADKGLFLVEDVLSPFSTPRELSVPRPTHPGTKICFASGLLIGGETKDVWRLMVVADYLRQTGVSEYVITGCFFADHREVGRQALSELDRALGHIGVKTTLVPSMNDLGSRVLPLDPIHHRLFASPVTSLLNPSRLDVGGERGLVTTRFVIEDLLRYLPQEIEGIQGGASEYKMHLDVEKLEGLVPKITGGERSIISAMDTLLKAGHVCPTAPDTILSVPFSERDEFVVADRVDYFCVGDTDEFLSGQSDDGMALLFTIPRFGRKHEVIVLDTETRALDVVRFDMEDLD